MKNWLGPQGRDKFIEAFANQEQIDFIQHRSAFSKSSLAVQIPNMAKERFSIKCF